MAGGFAFAQDIIYQPESIESESSLGIYTEDTDDFFSTINWQNLELEKVFMEFELQNEYLDTGLAFNAGSLYGAIYYNGNFLNNRIHKESTTTTELAKKATAPDPVKDPADFEVQSVTDDEEKYSTIQPYNNVAMMFGIGKIGIKLGYYTEGSKKKGYIGDNDGSDKTNTITKDKDGNVTKEVSYDENGKYYNEKYYVPFAGLGLNFDKFRPYLNFALPIFKDGFNYAETTKTYDAEGKLVAEVTDTYFRDDGFFGINPELGAEIDIGEAINGCLCFSYSPYIKLFRNVKDSNDNKLDYYGTIKNTKTITYNEDGTTETVYDTSINSNNYTEHSSMDHAISLSYSLSKDVAERFSIGAVFGVDANIGVEKSTTGVGYEKSVTKKGYAEEKDIFETSVKETNIELNPSCGIAFKVAIVPEKVNFIFGAGVTFNLGFTKTETTYSNAYTTSVARDEDGNTMTVYTPKDGGAEDKTEKENTFNTDYQAHFAAVFTPTDVFGFSVGFDIHTLVVEQNPFYALSVQAKVKF